MATTKNKKILNLSNFFIANLGKPFDLDLKKPIIFHGNYWNRFKKLGPLKQSELFLKKPYDWRTHNVEHRHMVVQSKWEKKLISQRPIRYFYNTFSFLTVRQVKNNMFVTLVAKKSGNVLYHGSLGRVGFRGPSRTTPQCANKFGIVFSEFLINSKFDDDLLVFLPTGISSLVNSFFHGLGASKFPFFRGFLKLRRKMHGTQPIGLRRQRRI